AYKEGKLVYEETFTLASRETKEITIPLTPSPVPNSDGWVQLFNGKDLSGWKTVGADPSNWQVTKDGLLQGSGPVGHLFSDRNDYQNFHFRVEARINDGGNSGEYFRAQPGDPFPHGYEAQINSTHFNPAKTGSLFGLADVKEVLVKPDEWFTQEVIAVGKHIVIKVNGKVVVDHVHD